MYKAYSFDMWYVESSTKNLVIRLANGGQTGGRAIGQAGGRVYPKWRQTEVSTCCIGSLYQEATWDCYLGVCD